MSDQLNDQPNTEPVVKWFQSKELCVYCGVMSHRMYALDPDTSPNMCETCMKEAAVDPTFVSLDSRLGRILSRLRELESVDIDDAVSDEIAKQLEDWDPKDSVLREYVRTDELETEFERFLTDAGVPDRDDLKDYVTEEDLAETIENVLEEKVIVQDVARGAVDALLAHRINLDKLDDTIRGLRSQLDTVEANLAELTRPKSFNSWVSWLRRR